MQTGIFFTFFYQPLYNGLVFLMDVLPWIDAGVAVILFTVIVKLILFPLSRTSVRTQFLIKKYDKELKDIRETYKSDRQEQALQTMNFYKEKKINPFSSLLLLFVQLPIIFALYRVFTASSLPAIDTLSLYSFVPQPELVKVYFLGLIDIASKSAPLAFLAALTSFYQIKFSLPPANTTPSGNQFKDDFARSMRIQMQYVFPVFVAVLAYNFSAALALYWITSNLFMIGQEIYIKREMVRVHG